MLNRRLFLQGSLATAALGAVGGLTGCAAPLSKQTTAPPRLFLSAVDNAEGAHFIAGIDSAGNTRFQLPVGDRCHGGCAHPDQQQAVVFARRPGHHFYVIDTAGGKIQHTVEAGPEHHFYGHGVFSADGRYLYVTVNHFISGEGLIRVYDARKNYQVVDNFPVDGIGPHELRLHPDGETLIIALGGIKTHPDYDRIKLNLDTMKPALLLMNRQSGRIDQRYAPSHHQLSCRHLDVSPEGVVIAGYQYQGPEWESPPLIARLDTRSGEFSEIALPSDLQASLNNYTASIAISPNVPHAAVTAPRGHRVLVLDYLTGDLVRTADVPDVAGALPDDHDGFIVSSGQGGVFHITPQAEAVAAIGHYAFHWDNHLTLAS
ncbi:DUF1513 domain-containing protein [Marinobacter sp. 1Y8]